MTLDYTVIGSRIRRLRKQKLLTQEELAERADVSPVYIRYIEKAKRTAKLDVNTCQHLSTDTGKMLHLVRGRPEMGLKTKWDDGLDRWKGKLLLHGKK